jgi:hypothetical protein
MTFYIFRKVPLSIIRSFSLHTQQWYMTYRFADSLRAGSGWNCSSILILLASCQQTCMTYTTAVCTVKNSWWWTEELSETCRVSFQNKFEKLVHLVGFIIRNLSQCTVTWTPNFVAVTEGQTKRAPMNWCTSQEEMQGCTKLHYNHRNQTPTVTYHMQ